MLDMRKIGAYISGLRKQKDITQLELADKLNISHQAVSKWERGESMPDIMMLPRLAEIFETSIDIILSAGESHGGGFSREAAVITSILDNKAHTIADQINRGDLAVQDVAEVAPILKPSTVSEIVKGISAINLEHICELAPFLDRNDLERMIQQVEIGAIPAAVLEELAPFARRETLDRLVDKVIDGSMEPELLSSIAPFISRQKLEQLVERVGDGIFDAAYLEELAPFLSREALERLVDRVIAGEVHVDTVIELAPFLGQESLHKLVVGIKAGQLNADVLSELAPFLSRSTLSEIVNEIIARANR